MPATTGSPQTVRFRDGDLEAALRDAKASGKLVFVDGWAPWCHTCLSMRQTVLDRPELGAYADRFEFVAVDTDRESSAAFVERYPMRVWPTFFVIDPASGAVLASYGGSLSLAETLGLLDRGLASRAHPEDRGARALAAAHAAYGDKRLEEAAKLYEDAAGLLPDAARAEPLVAAIRSLWQAEKSEACLALGERHLQAVRGSSAPVDFAFYLKECAERLGKDDPRRASTLGLVRAHLSGIAAAPPVGMSVDDRADLLATLAEIAKEAGEEASARKLQEERLSLLEAAAAAAKTPVDAQVFDYARMGAYLALGRGDAAVTMFEERARQLPDDYEPHARLGATLVELGRFREAVKPLGRAVELAYGPRRLRYLAQLAKACDKAGLKDEAVRALEREVAGWGALPAAQRDDKRQADAEARLAAARAR